jgi:hypothetical protein
MTEFLWDGPEDSDEEVSELLPYKCQYEKDLGIKYSKNGIMKFCAEFIANESKENKKDSKMAQAWDEKLKIPGIKMYLKKGGTKECPD